MSHVIQPLKKRESETRLSFVFKIFTVSISSLLCSGVLKNVIGVLTSLVVADSSWL